VSIEYASRCGKSLHARQAANMKAKGNTRITLKTSSAANYLGCPEKRKYSAEVSEELTESGIFEMKRGTDGIFNTAPSVQVNLFASRFHSYRSNGAAHCGRRSGSGAKAEPNAAPDLTNIKAFRDMQLTERAGQASLVVRQLRVNDPISIHTIGT
jgi:hypothetical protein